MSAHYYHPLLQDAMNLPEDSKVYTTYCSQSEFFPKESYC